VLDFGDRFISLTPRNEHISTNHRRLDCVEDPDVVETHLRHFTIRLKPEASAKDLIWELSNLFPSGTAATIQ
jgi:hypothetical protein